jgi:hypothetical protein
VGTTDEDNDIEYVLCGMCDDEITDKYVHVNSDESIYAMNLGDMYDDLIMPEPEKVET